LKREYRLLTRRLPYASRMRFSSAVMDSAIEDIHPLENRTVLLDRCSQSLG